MYSPAATLRLRKRIRHLYADLSLRSTYILLTLIMLFATARRWYAIERDSLWSDELWGVYACSLGSWWAMIQDLIYNDSHPPGYQTLLYWWMQLFGNTDIAIRLPSVVAGVVTVAITFELGRRHLSTMTGIIAAAIVSGSYQAIYYSQEARAYAFLMLLAPACALYFTELFIKRNVQLRTLAAFWACSTAMIYMHYVGFVFIGSAILLWCLLRIFEGSARQPFTLALQVFSPALLLYSPWLPVMHHHMTNSPDTWTTQTPDAARLWETLTFLLGPDRERTTIYLACMLASLGIFAKRLVAPQETDIQQHLHLKHTVYACLLWLSVFPIVVFYLKSQWSQSVYTLRHFTYAIPLLALLTACLPAIAIRQIRTGIWRNASLLAVVIGLAVLTQNGNTENKLYGNRIRQDYRGAVDLIRYDKTFMKKDNIHFIASSHAFFDHYLATFHIKPRADIYVDRAENIPALKTLLTEKQATRFYYLTEGGGETPDIITLLEQQFEARCYSRLNKMHVVKFSTSPPAPNVQPLSELHDCPLKTMTRPFRDGQPPDDD